MSEGAEGGREASPLTAENITVLILAGGTGSRLQGITDTPKPIVPVEGKPFLVHLLDALMGKGLRRAIVCTGHGASQVAAAANHGNPGMELAFSAETAPLGTAGALRLAAAGVGTSHILAMNGDSWCDFDLEALLAFQRGHPGRPTLIATQVPDAGRFGQLELDGEDRVLAFREKGHQADAGWINAGLYLLPAALLRDVPDRAPLSLEREVMPDWIAGGLFAFRSAAPFLDIGTPESYAQKEAFVRSMIESRLDHARRTMFTFPKPPVDAPLKAGVGVLLVNAADEILLERRSDCGWWGLIGGAVQSGESVSDTARREIREETGLEVQLTGLQGVYSNPATHCVRYPDRGDVKQLIDIVVHARIVAGTPVASRESEELRFFRRDQLPPESEIALPAREPLRDWARGHEAFLPKTGSFLLSILSPAAMIISRTPYRLSFFGGGTDYPGWYQEHGGAVLATTFNKYCYISVRHLPPFFEHRFRVVYSVTETCQTAEEIRHPAVRGALQHLGLEKGLEIHHDGDLPARSGLGSSSSFVVGLLHALHALQGGMSSKRDLAAEAIHVEQKILNESVGAQDQVMAAHGGLNVVRFHPDGEIAVRPLILPAPRVRELNDHLMLFFTGVARTSSDIAGHYLPELKSKAKQLSAYGPMVEEAQRILLSNESLDGFGSLLHEAWMLKRSLSDRISTPAIDEIYQSARDAGALGGKIIGAGGGGFLLLFARTESQPRIRARLHSLLEVPFEFEHHGSQIIFYDPEN